MEGVRFYVRKEKDADFGVFAYHTNNDKYDECTLLPNFMPNQLINLVV